MTNFQTTEINLHGFRFNAFVAGAADGDLVLLLHGFPEFGDAWRDVMQPIAEAGFRGCSGPARLFEGSAAN
jgi:pimeloyl-ACP methyl ester carboxylesterase